MDEKMDWKLLSYNRGSTVNYLAQLDIIILS
jgi:hypothetical protein